MNQDGKQGNAIRQSWPAAERRLQSDCTMARDITARCQSGYVSARDADQKSLTALKRLLVIPLILTSLARAEDRLLNVRVSAEDGGRPVVDIATKTGAGELQTLKKDVQIPWQGTLQEPADHSGSIMIIASGYWSGTIPIAEDNSDLEFRLFPVGSLSGRLDFGDSKIRDLVFIEFKMLASARNNVPNTSGSAHESPSLNDVQSSSERGLPSGRVKCKIDETTFECPVPSGLLDARISIDDFAPEYFWRISAEPKKVTWLGVRKLIRGLSVAGWVELPADFPPDQRVIVKVEPQEYTIAPGEKERGRTDLLSRMAEVSERGFFQIKGMRPGAYDIHAFGGEFGSTSQQLLVKAGSEGILLERPLVLTPPSNLEIFIDPLLDPWGGAWRIDVIRQEKISNTYATVKSLEASLSGFVKADAVKPGNYKLQVFDSRGFSWLEKEVTVSPESERIMLEISSVPIRGTVKIGNLGCAATLIFGTRNSEVSIAITSDTEGNFEGILPYEGEWPVEIEMDDGLGDQAAEPVTVQRKPGKTFAELQIDLPNTVVKGKVIEDGNPADAFVLAIRELEQESNSAHGGLRRRDITRRTDSDGTFLVKGVSPGPLKLFAYNGKRSSDWLTVIVEEDEEATDVVLELKQKVELNGSISRGGSAISGARIIAFPNEGLGLETVSAPDGRFELKVPRYVKWLDFVVLAPEAPLFVHRQLLDEKDVQRVDLSSPLESMDLLVADIPPFGYLYSHGISVSLSMLMSTLIPAGRIKPAMGGGFVIRGVAPGDWSLCPGPVYSEADCATAQSFQGGTQPTFQPTTGNSVESEQ